MFVVSEYLFGLMGLEYIILQHLFLQLLVNTVINITLFIEWWTATRLVSIVVTLHEGFLRILYSKTGFYIYLVYIKTVK